MSEVFASATVTIAPNVSGFAKNLDALLKAEMLKVKTPVVRVAPALTRNFLGDLRRQVNAAVAKVQPKPIHIRVIVDAPSRRQLSNLAAGAPIAVGGVRGTGAGATGALDEEIAKQTKINSLIGQGGILLGSDTSQRRERNAAMREGAKAVEESTVSERASVAAQKGHQSVMERLATLDDRLATSAGERAKANLLVKDSLISLPKLEDAHAKAIEAKDKGLQKSIKNTIRQVEANRELGRTTIAKLDTAGPAPTGPSRTVTRARAAGIAGLRSTVGSIRETDVLEQKLTKDTKDLSAAQQIAHRRAIELAGANKLVAASLRAQSDSLRVAAVNTQSLAKSQDAAAKARVTGINQAIQADKQREIINRKAASAAATEARSEKRRSEQLSRGGQASILSLAGIRGATLAASRSFLIGAAAITVFAKAVRAFADLERNLDVFQATASATAVQMEAVRKESTALGADLTLPSVSAGDAAGAMVELAKAGLSVQDSIDGARGVLELSTAAAIDNADAVRLVANVLNAFSLAGRDAVVVADTLANAANASQGSIADMGVAFQQAASAGHQVGLSFRDTATFLTILAKNGLRGSDAGTSLRTALIRLINPSKEAAGQFEKLGIVLRDSEGNLRPDVFLQIASATSALTPAARDATIALIGGQDAFRAVTILGRQSVDAFLAMREALHRQGTAAELAEARTRGLHGAMDGLGSVLATVGTTASGHVGPALANFVRTVSSGITAFSESDQVAKGLSQTLTATGQAFGALGAAIKGVGAVTLPVVNLLSQLVTSIGVGTILAGVLAWKTFSAVLDGAIVRMTILRPLMGRIATAKIGASLATGFTTASIALEQFNKQVNGSVKNTTAITGFARLTQVQKELAVATAASTVRLSAFRVATSATGLALLSLLSPTNIAIAAVAGIAAGLFILATRESAAEKAAKSLKSAISGLTSVMGAAKSALDSYNQSLRTISATRQAVDQAKQTLALRKSAVATSQAVQSSTQYQRLLIALAISRQDVKFAEEDYAKAVSDSNVQLEIADQAERNLIAAREKAAESAIKLVALEKIGGDDLLALNIRLAGQFQKRAQALREENTAESLALAKRLEVLAKISKELGEPSSQAIQLLIEVPNLKSALAGVAKEFGITGKTAVRDFVDSWIAEMNGVGAAKLQAHWQSVIESVTQWIPDVTDEATKSGTKAADDWMAAAAAAARRRQKELADALIAAFADAQRQASNALKNLDVQEDLAVIASGSPGATLGVQQDRLANAIADRKVAEKELADLQKVGSKTGLASARERRADAISREATAREAIRGINKQAAADAKSAADDLARDQDAAGQKIVDAITQGRRATQLQRKITSAGLTAWLGDDLKTNQVWLAYLIKQKATLVARLKAVGASKEIITKAMQAISDLIFGIKNEITKTTQDQQAALQGRITRKLDLRIQIAEANENIPEQIRLHRLKLQRISVELVKAKKQYGKNSEQWLELKLAQAEERAAINDLTDELKKGANATAAMQFQFLQMQTGFAANLLGNLIPMGATSGLVGGSAAGGGGTQGGVFGTGIPLPAGVQRGDSGNSPVKGLASQSATKSAGPTRTSQQRQNQLLIQILRVLQNIYRGTGHPEAKHRQKTTLTDMDYGGGGGNGSSAT